jgi:hypothetical protein
MKKAIMFPLLAAACVLAAALTFAQGSAKPTATQGDARLDRVLQQNEQVLKNQEQILKNQEEILKQLAELKEGVLQLRRRTS